MSGPVHRLCGSMKPHDTHRFILPHVPWTADCPGVEVRQEMERGGEDNAAHMGLVKRAFENGQQVLGTCSPADTITYSALLSRLQRIHDARITYVEKDAVEACMNEVRALLGGSA